MKNLKFSHRKQMVQCSIHVKRVRNGKSGNRSRVAFPASFGSDGKALAVCSGDGYKLVKGTTVSSPAHRSRWLSGTAPAVQRRQPPSADTC